MIEKRRWLKRRGAPKGWVKAHASHSEAGRKEWVHAHPRRSVGRAPKSRWSSETSWAGGEEHGAYVSRRMRHARR